MRIDLPVPGAWDSLCDSYRKALPFQDIAVNVQIHFGYRLALFEATQGLAKLFSHKKTVAILESTDFAFAEIAKSLSQEGFNVHVLRAEDLKTPETWLAQISSELLFVLTSEDDPITAKLIDRSHLNAALKDKRVFNISLSHANHQTEAVTRPALYDVRILSLAPERALLVAGERFRVQVGIAPQTPWPLEEDLRARQWLSLPIDPVQIEKNKSTVLGFEASLPDGYKAYFSRGEQRVFDRAVIYADDLDGSAIIDALAREIGVDVGAIGLDAKLETTSGCRWISQRMTEWLIQRGEDPKQIRGLVLISADLLNADLSSALGRVSHELRRIQSGDET